MNGNELLHLGLAFGLLAAAVWQDLRTRKVSNQFLIGALITVIIYQVVFQGPASLMNSGMSFLMATVIVLPIYLLKVLGGGDVKLFLVVSLLLPWDQVLLAICASFIWGSLLGIFQVVLKKQGLQFLKNLKSILARTKVSNELTHKIPFTVALFFGFATALAWRTT